MGPHRHRRPPAAPTHIPIPPPPATPSRPCSKPSAAAAAARNSRATASPAAGPSATGAASGTLLASDRQTGMRLHTADGLRKYLTAGECDGFLRQAERADREVRTLCMTLAHGGCRLSEALPLTADRVDLGAGVLVFESLKKPRRGILRSVPVPPALLDVLDVVHGIREIQARRGKGDGMRLWPWSRMTGWRQQFSMRMSRALSCLVR
jgi:integrase